MDQTSDPVCPVCTLTVRREISLEEHLNTHPKDQVIRALINRCSSNSPSLPPPPPLTPAPTTFQFMQPPSSVVQYPYNFIPVVYSPYGVQPQPSFLPQNLFNASSLTSNNTPTSRAAISATPTSVNVTLPNLPNVSVPASLPNIPVPVSNVSLQEIPVPIPNIPVSMPDIPVAIPSVPENIPDVPIIQPSEPNESVITSGNTDLQEESRDSSEHDTIVPDSIKPDIELSSPTLETPDEDDESSNSHCHGPGRFDNLILGIREDKEYITSDYSPASMALSPSSLPLSPTSPQKKEEEEEEDEDHNNAVVLSDQVSTMEQFSSKDTVSMRDIQTDETMPAQGELSEQESLGADTTSLWGQTAEDAFSELASQGHASSQHLLSDWPSMGEGVAQQGVQKAASSSTEQRRHLRPEIVEGYTSEQQQAEQWVKVEQEVKVEEEIVETHEPEKVLISVIGEESLIVSESAARRLQKCTICDCTFSKVRELLLHRRKEHRATKYNCSICQEEFSDRKLYYEHSKSHPLECLQCGKTFNRRQGLTLHMKRHLGVKPHKCLLCDKSFVTKQKLSEHMNSHTGRTPHTCKQCGKCFKRYSNLIQHKNWVHLQLRKPIKDMMCDFCGKIFHTKKRLAWHLETHLQTPRVCVHCPQRFIHNSSLTRHIRTMHDRKYMPNLPPQTSAECPECSGVFCRTSLVVHMRTHSGERPFSCNICFKAFSTKWNLQQHRWTHENPTTLPLRCTQCRKSYYRQEDLQAHIRSHRSQRPFTCDYCGRKFVRKYNCIRHMREHVLVKQHTCSICQKSFHRSYYLKEHLRVHTGLKPFACHICGKGSTTKSNHNKHIRTHHARESVTPEG